MSTTSRAPAQPDTLVQLLTCTRPGHRGRGLATALKGRVIRYARERGYRWIRTFNDASNAPILAVNRRLGFRRVVTWIELERTVGESDGPPRR
jgi:GNAT superfamily N-acetyltransferase